MPSTHQSGHPRGALAALAVAAVVALIAVIGVTAAGAGADRGTPMRMAMPTDHAFGSRALALHDRMRALWEAHGTWTERAIVDFAGGLPDTQLVVDRLLRNQAQIGRAVEPYYGKAGARGLTRLLKAHIRAAVGLLQAAKSGDAAATAQAKAAFYANGNQVARFLHHANPRHWSLPAMKQMMRTHLDQVVALAVDQLQGHYPAAVRLYNRYIAHILDMADMLSDGIVQQFPARFR
jgi:hypothetical protein